MTDLELIESGIIESYCLGLATEEERALVNRFAQRDRSVRIEIDAVINALALYALQHTPPPSYMKKRIMSAIEQENVPPLLTADTTVEEWVNYIRKLNIQPPDEYKSLMIIDLAGNAQCQTFAAWAHAGDELPEEVHHDQNEYLFICSGECVMTIDGKKTAYKKGGFIAIPPGLNHSAVITGKETMLVIVQRRAA
ncbi:MAG: cupin domain-containing protein [Chitinophagales bacterium]|nr:cupin domain-containing protein [Chitinophagales bacterium]